MERESVAYIPACISRVSKLVHALAGSPRALGPACSQRGRGEPAAVPPTSENASPASARALGAQPA